MANLIAFLKARVGEDDARANAMQHFTVHEQPYYSCAASRTEPCGDLEWGEDACDCFLAERKARALREVAAKRAILDAYLRTNGDSPRDRDRGRWDALHAAVLLLAAVYSNHPDYRKEWEQVDG